MISFLALVISLRISFRISALKAFMSNAGGSENSAPFTCCINEKHARSENHHKNFPLTHFPFIFDGKPHKNHNKPLKSSLHWRFRSVYATEVNQPMMMLHSTMKTMEVFVNCYCSTCAVACLTFPISHVNHRHLVSAT